MLKITGKRVVITLALFAALILAFFPTQSFMAKPYILNTNVKQQHYNTVGLFTITPYEAAKFYSYDQGNCYWIDARNASEFSKSHLKIAINQTLGQLENTKWNADDLLLIYGNNTEDAQKVAAYLRQVENTRAFAIEGGFRSVKKYLIDPIGISITNQFSDKDLTNLIELRNKLSGKNVSSTEMLKTLKSSKPKTIREGC